MNDRAATATRLFRTAGAALLGAVLAALVSVAALAFEADPRLRDFAAAVGLADSGRFADTVAALQATGKLPERYIAKRPAERRGWKPNADLCRTAPGQAIGGDTFNNREKRLPIAPQRRWREADLDYACGARGVKRLLWSSDGLFFVTLDHYESFIRVPVQ